MKKFLPHIIASILLFFAFYQTYSLKREIKNLELHSANTEMHIGEVHLMLSGFVEQAPSEMRAIAREEVVKGFREFAENFKNSTGTTFKSADLTEKNEVE